MKTSIFSLFVLAVVGLLMVGCNKEAPAEEAPAAAPEAAAEADAAAEPEAKTEKENVTVEEKAEQPASGAAAESTGIAACDDYMKAFEKYMACDAIPQQTKDMTKQGLDAMKSSWATMKDAPEASKKAAGDSCQAALDGLRQGAKAMNCDI